MVFKQDISVAEFSATSVGRRAALCKAETLSKRPSADRTVKHPGGGETHVRERYTIKGVTLRSDEVNEDGRPLVVRHCIAVVRWHEVTITKRDDWEMDARREDDEVMR